MNRLSIILAILAVLTIIIFAIFEMWAGIIIIVMYLAANFVPKWLKYRKMSPMQKAIRKGTSGWMKKMEKQMKNQKSVEERFRGANVVGVTCPNGFKIPDNISKKKAMELFLKNADVNSPHQS